MKSYSLCILLFLSFSIDVLAQGGAPWRAHKGQASRYQKPSTIGSRDWFGLEEKIARKKGEELKEAVRKKAAALKKERAQSASHDEFYYLKLRFEADYPGTEAIGFCSLDLMETYGAAEITNSVLRSSCNFLEDFEQFNFERSEIDEVLIWVGLNRYTVYYRNID